MGNERMNIVYKKVANLVPYENNPRNNEEAVDYVANSIKVFGFKVPVVVDKDNIVVAGHTRLKACEKLGITEVPCIVAEDLTEDQIKAFRIARKSLYGVMCCPSCVKVSAMGITEYRIQHEIKWNNAVPKLLSPRWRKHIHK